MNQCWIIVDWTLGNQLQWNLNRNIYIFIQENAFENVVWKMSIMLSLPQCHCNVLKQRVMHSWQLITFWPQLRHCWGDWRLLLPWYTRGWKLSQYWLNFDTFLEYFMDIIVRNSKRHNGPRSDTESRTYYPQVWVIFEFKVYKLHYRSI